MPEHDLEKLLGAFAADTLTPEERQRLFTVALQDQQLFNALADEQALKELLANPDIRRRLLQSLKTSAGPSRSWWRPFTGPSGLAWAGGIAAGVFAVVLGFKVYQDNLHHTSQIDVTEERPPTAPSPPPAAAPPAKAPP